MCFQECSEWVLCFVESMLMLILSICEFIFAPFTSHFPSCQSFLWGWTALQVSLHVGSDNYLSARVGIPNIWNTAHTMSTVWIVFTWQNSLYQLDHSIVIEQIFSCGKQNPHINIFKLLLCSTVWIYILCLSFSWIFWQVGIKIKFPCFELN